MRIWHKTGIELPAGVLRTLIPDHQDHGATTGPQLVHVMRLFGLRPVYREMTGNAVLPLLARSVVAGVPPIILGTWVSPMILHWVLVVDAMTTGVAVNDPWGGVRRFIPQNLLLQRYAGGCIL